MCSGTIRRCSASTNPAGGMSWGFPIVKSHASGSPIRRDHSGSAKKRLIGSIVFSAALVRAVLRGPMRRAGYYVPPRYPAYDSFCVAWLRSISATRSFFVSKVFGESILGSAAPATAPRAPV